MRITYWIFVSFVIWLAGCGEGPPVVDSAIEEPSRATTNAELPGTLNSRPETPIRFKINDSVNGIGFQYKNGEEAGLLSIVESLGGGVGVIDFDNDGWWDLFFPGGGCFKDHRAFGFPNYLFWNRHDDDFLDMHDEADVANSRYYSHAGAVCDFDNDGFHDILVTGFGGLQLFHNQGDGTFERVSDAALETDKLWSSSAAWGDFNGDSYPDVYVAHYVNWSFDHHPACRSPAGDKPDICPPRSFEPLPDRLYLGNGDGSFRDATAEFGLRPDGKGLGVVVADFDLDGDADVYVTNDTTDNFLYLNDSGRGFVEQGKLSGVALNDIGHPDGSMGTDVGDFDGDGLPDLSVANYERETTAVYRNLGQANFLHVSQASGVASVGSGYVGWGAVAGDFDLDADEDLFIANGHVIRHPLESTVDQQPLMFENRSEQRMRFENVTQAVGDYFRTTHHGRGAARGDFNRDGRIDLAISHNRQIAEVLINESETGNHFVTLQLVGTVGNRQAIGSIVTLELSGRQQVRQLQGGGSYASTHAAEITFGLGTATEIPEVAIRWPSGVEQVLRGLKSDRQYRVVEGDAQAYELKRD